MSIPIETVDRLIAKHGRPATHVVSANTPAAIAWNAPTGSEVTTEIVAVFLDFSLKDIDGTILKKGDQRVLISGSVPDIEKGQIIREGVSPNNVDWKIVAANIVEPGTTRYLYDLVVNK